MMNVGVLQNYPVLAATIIRYTVIPKQNGVIVQPHPLSRRLLLPADLSL